MNKLLLIALSAFITFTSKAFASEPVNWAFGMQPSVSLTGDRLHSFHDMMLYIITAITVFVFLLLVYVVIRFNKKANPKPANFSHNTMIEVIWTAIPVIILFIIAYPSLKLLFYMDRTPEPEMTLKVTGYQWYWGYEYPDHDGINFLSYMVPTADLKPGERRLLETDNPVVLPVDTTIQIQVTAADVLHAWAMPAFSLKTDAVPGRLNETWVRVTETGTYYGQCSEICGTGHAFMPIKVKVVSKEEFAAWVEQAKKEFASNDNQIDMIRSHELASELTNAQTPLLVTN